jgi:hypothetical protein
VTHIGTARFTAMDKHGELRTFDVPDCHVIPSCKKILVGNYDAESHDTYYVQPDNDEWHLRIPCGAHLPVIRTANDLSAGGASMHTERNGHEGSWILQTGNDVQRTRLASTSSRYVRRILRRYRSGYVSAEGTVRVSGILRRQQHRSRNVQHTRPRSINTEAWQRY